MNFWAQKSTVKLLGQVEGVNESVRRHSPCLQSGLGRAFSGKSGEASSRAAFAANRPFSSVSNRRSQAAVDSRVLQTGAPALTVPRCRMSMLSARTARSASCRPRRRDVFRPCSCPAAESVRWGRRRRTSDTRPCLRVARCSAHQLCAPVSS